MEKQPRKALPPDSLYSRGIYAPKRELAELEEVLDFSVVQSSYRSGEYVFSEQLGLEQEVLTAAVWSEKALPYIVEKLELDDFTAPVLRQTFRVIRERFVAGDGVSAVLLRPLIDEMAYAVIADPGCTLFSQVGEHCAQMVENTRVRKLRELGERLVASDVHGLDALLEEGMTKLVRRDGFKGVDLFTAGKLSTEERVKGTVSQKMIDLPWAKMNSCMRGLHAGWVCIIAGRPGHGKTAAAIDLTLSAAKQDKKVLFVSLEMDAQELFVRVAQRFGLDSEHYYMGGMDEKDWEALDEANRFQPLKNVRIEYADTMAKITSLVRSVRPDLLIIDYVQLIRHDHKDRVEGMTQTSHGIKALARRYQLPVVEISQLSRAAKDQRGKIPNMGDLRDSGALEQDADQIIFVWQHEDPEHHIVMGRGVFVGAKARMGKVGKQAFTFQGAKQLFVTEA